MTKKAKGNIDYINGVIIPAQTYAFSGRQWGTSGEDVAGKKPTDASPMVITSQPPGAFAKTDESWALTFGASHDAWLSLFNSAFMANSPALISDGDVYGKGGVHANDFNLFKPANDIQQIAYIVNKNTAAEFRDSPKLVNEFAARSLGLRIPQMAAGYGKTVGLRPTDPDPQTDDRKNDEEHKLARETWKYGPFVPRWDERIAGWSCFNDLITGQDSDIMGTLVHSTNPDEDEGFPFLKGKLHDVWWVRKTEAQNGVNGKDSDFDQSGEVCTHLEHRWYDDETKTVAPLSSIFTIPGPDAADCHGAASGPQTLGSEETYTGTNVDIKTTAHFNMVGSDKDGQINFSAVTIPPDDICSSSDGYYHRGVVFFDDESCVWDVAVKLDECDLAGGHFIKLAQNDINIMENLTAICNSIASWGGGGGAVSIHQPGGYSAPDAHDANFGQVASSLLCLQANIVLSNANAIQNAINNDAAILAAAQGYTDSAIATLVASINTWITGSLIPALIACCGEEGAAGVGTINPEFPAASPPGGVTREIPEYFDCELFVLPMPRLNCEYCFGVHINIPCGETENALAGDACFINEPPVASTQYGACQAHG